jgi:hypothetical protein
MYPVGVQRRRPGIHPVERGGKFGWWRKSRGGFRDDLKREYRSSWEANIHRLLLWMQAQKIPLTGRHISYETVYVQFNPRRGGPLGYHPDFVLYLASPVIVGERSYTKAHIEITGFKDRKKLEKMKRLIEDYGDKNGIMMIEIDENVYELLSQSYGEIVPNWEHDRRSRKDGHGEVNNSQQQ